MRNSQRTARA
ncbi:hypothetical protein YPPY34_3881, partial [Yersinia pestis PY-34]